MIGNGENFAPSESSFMVNYRVADLSGLLTALRAENCNVLEKTEESEFGKFGWVIDPEGNKIELWEPPTGGYVCQSTISMFLGKTISPCSSEQVG